MKSQAKSRIGNGTDLLAGVDGRTSTMRRYREIFGALSESLGDNAPEAKLIMVRRCATLSVWCEQIEADLANGQQIDVGAFMTATNTLRRILADLGLIEERQHV